jgi:hypothetical protein
MRAEIPRIRPRLAMFEPIALPRAMAPWSSREARTLTTISRAEVP